MEETQARMPELLGPSQCRRHSCLRALALFALCLLAPLPTYALDLKITHEEGISGLGITTAIVKGTRRY